MNQRFLTEGRLAAPFFNGGEKEEFFFSLGQSSRDSEEGLVRYRKFVSILSIREPSS